jgi:hypothetical protein
LRGTRSSPEISDEALRSRTGAAWSECALKLDQARKRFPPTSNRPPIASCWSALRKLDWQVEIYLEGPKLATVLPRLRGQGVKVVVDHFGAPDPAQGVACAGFQEVLRGVKAGDTFVKLSAPYRQGGADVQPYVDALLDAGGPSQLVWATDWPFIGFEGQITYAQCVSWIEAWIPDAAARRIVDGGNAGESLWISPSPVFLIPEPGEHMIYRCPDRACMPRPHSPRRPMAEGSSFPTPPGAAPTASSRPREGTEPLLERAAIISNVPGPGGTIGVAQHVRAAPDGQTSPAEWAGPITVAPNTTKVPYAPNDFTCRSSRCRARPT